MARLPGTKHPQQRAVGEQVSLCDIEGRSDHSIEPGVPGSPSQLSRSGRQGSPGALIHSGRQDPGPPSPGTLRPSPGTSRPSPAPSISDPTSTRTSSHTASLLRIPAVGWSPVAGQKHKGTGECAGAGRQSPGQLPSQERGPVRSGPVGAVCPAALPILPRALRIRPRLGWGCTPPQCTPQAIGEAPLSLSGMPGR